MGFHFLLLNEMSFQIKGCKYISFPKRFPISLNIFKHTYPSIKTLGHGLDKFNFQLLQALNAASVDFVFYDSFRHFCGSTKTISYKHCLCSSEMQNGHNTVFANAVSSKNNICYYQFSFYASLTIFSFSFISYIIILKTTYKRINSQIS